MQFYSGEDPATGSAAGCAIAWLVKHAWVESGREVTLRQGLELGRPSRLVVRAVRQGEGVGSITVSGSTILVAGGAFFLPRLTKIYTGDSATNLNTDGHSTASQWMRDSELTRVFAIISRLLREVPLRMLSKSSLGLSSGTQRFRLIFRTIMR